MTTATKLAGQDPVAAIRIVARRVFANAVADDPVDPEWENYPEIGGDDWQAVLAYVRELAQRTDVHTEDCDAAYRHLAERAEEEEET